MTNRLWVTVPFLVLGSLITPHAMTKRMWAAVPLISSYLTHDNTNNSQWANFVFCTVVPLHLIPWATVCEWPRLPCPFFPAASLDIIPWPTGCEWQHPIFQPSSLTTSHAMTNSLWVLPSSLITSYAMTNSLWVTAPFFCQGVSSHLMQWPTACEWQCPLAVQQSHFISSHDQ